MTTFVDLRIVAAIKGYVGPPYSTRYAFPVVVYLVDYPIPP
jgi:hypothetical protein